MIANSQAIQELVPKIEAKIEQLQSLIADKEEELREVVFDDTLVEGHFIEASDELLRKMEEE